MGNYMTIAPVLPPAVSSTDRGLEDLLRVKWGFLLHKPIILNVTLDGLSHHSTNVRNATLWLIEKIGTITGTNSSLSVLKRSRAGIDT
jgi:hypothetical protein